MQHEAVVIVDPAQCAASLCCGQINARQATVVHLDPAWAQVFGVNFVVYKGDGLGRECGGEDRIARRKTQPTEADMSRIPSASYWRQLVEILAAASNGQGFDLEVNQVEDAAAGQDVGGGEVLVRARGESNIGIGRRRGSGGDVDVDAIVPGCWSAADGEEKALVDGDACAPPAMVGGVSGRRRRA